MRGSERLKETKGLIGSRLSSIQAGSGRPEAPGGRPSPEIGQKRKGYDSHHLVPQLLVTRGSSADPRRGIPQGLASQPGIKEKGSEGLKDTKGVIGGRLSSIQAESGRPKVPLGRPSPDSGQKRKEYDRQDLANAAGTGVPQGLAPQPGIKEKETRGSEGLKETNKGVICDSCPSTIQAESRRPEATGGHIDVADANTEISNKLDVTIDQDERRRELEKKLQALKEKRHGLVQMLKQIQLAEDKFKRENRQQSSKVEQKITRQNRQQSSKVEQKITRQNRQQCPPQQSMPSRSPPATSLVRPAHGTLQHNEVVQDPKCPHPDPQDDKTHKAEEQ